MVGVVCAIGGFMGAAAHAATEDKGPLLALGLEELMEVEVTTVGRKSQLLSEAPAAVHVITAEEIRRSGATSLPEALRLAPGMTVAQMGSHTWAVSTRGFADEFGNKVLVMIDGRTIYNNVYEGVYWDAQDIALQNVERIEVVRGPGGTLWGANAVNGVINVVTRSAADTQGTVVSVEGGGPREQATVRHGVELGPGAHLRFTAKRFEADPLKEADGETANDAWRQGRAGFRLDWAPAWRDQVMVEGDVYSGSRERLTNDVLFEPPYTPTVRDEEDIAGGYLLGRWQRRYRNGSSWTFKSYYDYRTRDKHHLQQHRRTFDLDFQHQFQVGARHEVMWGLDYRAYDDELDGKTYVLEFDPQESSSRVAGAFLQDEIALRPDLFLTLGTKLEDNEYTGTEHQPNARLLWRATETDTLWAAVSRAVRTPARAHTDLRANVAAFPADGLPGLVAVLPHQDPESVDVTSAELGYRGQPGPRTYLDVALFYNEYEDLYAIRDGAPFYEHAPVPHLVFPLYGTESVSGYTRGLEVVAQWQVRSDWRLEGSYSLLDSSFNVPAGSHDSGIGQFVDHQVQLHSRVDVTDRVEWDADLYWVDDMGPAGFDAYARFDMRVGWRPRPGVELSLAGKNLLDPRHPELFSSDHGVDALEVPRSVQAKVTVEW